MVTPACSDGRGNPVTTGGFDPHSLESNEQFISAVLQTTVLAVKTHQEEKLEAFRNAVLNSVLPGAPDEYEQMTFLRYVDELTPLHVQLLSFWADPRGWFAANGRQVPNWMAISLQGIMAEAFPQLAPQQPLTDLVLNDLMSRRLFVEATVRGTGTGQGMMAKRTTELGDCFLRFISSPA